MKEQQVACMPDGTPGYVPADGAALVACPRCGRRCWLGPRSAERVAACAADFACVFCVAAMHGTEMLTGEIRVIDPAAPLRFDQAALDASLGAMDDVELRNLGVDARTNRPHRETPMDKPEPCYPVTKDAAIAMLPPDEIIEMLFQPESGPNVTRVGRVPRQRVLDILAAAQHIEESGLFAQRAGYGIHVLCKTGQDGYGRLFIATRPECRVPDEQLMAREAAEYARRQAAQPRTPDA